MVILRKTLALTFLALWSGYLYAEPLDCSSYHSIPRRVVCENPAIQQLEANYENLLKELQRANPKAVSYIQKIRRDKVSELGKQCQSAECVSDWYKNQIFAIQNGTWGPSSNQSEAQTGSQNKHTQEAVAEPQRTAEASGQQTKQEVGNEVSMHASVSEKNDAPVREVQTQNTNQPIPLPITEAESNSIQKTAQEARTERPVNLQKNRVMQDEEEAMPSNKKIFTDMGFFSILFIILLGTPLTFFLWKVVVWLDQYMISKAERYRIPSATIAIQQVGLSAVLGYGIAGGIVILISSIF